MVILAKLIRTVLKFVLLNKTVRYALIAALLRFGRYAIRPSTISRIKSFASGLGRAAAGSGRSGLLSRLLLGAAELLVLMFAKKGGFTSAGFLSSALAAMLLSMSRKQEHSQANGGKGEKEQVIDLDDYTILEDNH